MIGTRVELIPQPGGFQALKPGEYGRWTDGTWYATTPNGEGAWLASHSVVEHEDGTITVSPSIEVYTPKTETRPRKSLWHGFLERGVWREA